MLSISSTPRSASDNPPIWLLTRSFSRADRASPPSHRQRPARLWSAPPARRRRPPARGPAAGCRRWRARSGRRWLARPARRAYVSSSSVVWSGGNGRRSSLVNVSSKAASPSVRTVSNTATSPRRTSSSTTVADALSSNCASSTATTIRRSVATSAAVSSSTSSRTAAPPSARNARSGSSAAKAPSGIPAAACVPYARCTVNWAKSSRSTISLTSLVFPTPAPAGPATTAPPWSRLARTAAISFARPTNGS